MYGNYEECVPFGYSCIEAIPIQNYTIMLFTYSLYVYHVA